jgi:capsular polysaccharide export protein
MPVQAAADLRPQVTASPPFLRIPPFPGGKVDGFRVLPNEASGRELPADLPQLLRQLRVGGSFWAAQPRLPERYLLVRSSQAIEASAALHGEVPVLFWPTHSHSVVKNARNIVTEECDPWHMLGNSIALVTETSDELVLIAALLGVAVYISDPAGELRRYEPDIPKLLTGAISASGYLDPFTGKQIDVSGAVELCGFWRRLVDSNRGIAGGLGFAFWKQDNVATLLWGGSDSFEFFRSDAEIDGRSGPVAIWRSKAPTAVLASLEEEGRGVLEVEDGFLRSQGLGADCIPPLSITVDRLGAYFDPGRPSELENLLQNGDFDEQSLERARYLRGVIVEAGLSKYSRGDQPITRPAGSRRHILVPGQVEDDRSVQLGGCGLTSNLDLLMRVRDDAPDAYILYKPHPDVLAGHRKGAIPEEHSLRYADEIVGEEPISALIGMADEVHVNTSLAGFEALLRGKPVTTHGVPFYAGWGLTRDLGPVPGRRSAVRSLDELVVAALLSYPRYLDPATGLPCPPEVVVARLIEGDVPETNLLVAARRLQGKVLRSVRSLVQ